MTKKTASKHDEALTRLMIENGNLRRKNEELGVIIRRRSPNADGLPLVSALKTILDDRDRAAGRIQFFRNELKKVMKLLLAGNGKDALKEINHFLFHNRE